MTINIKGKAERGEEEEGKSSNSSGSPWLKNIKPFLCLKKNVLIGRGNFHGMLAPPV
jgi:hypothetical protein